MSQHPAFKISLDDLFAKPAWIRKVGSDHRSIIKRFVNEQGPRLQRLAWAFNNFGDAPPDEAEFADIPYPGFHSGQSLREVRASARWNWIVDLAHEAIRVRLWAQCPSWQQWGYGQDESVPWGMRAPTLKDVLGSSIIRAISCWEDFERSQARKLVEFALARLDAIAADRTAAGVLALFLARLNLLLTSVPAALDRLVETLTERVRAPGGQTTRFAPLN